MVVEAVDSEEVVEVAEEEDSEEVLQEGPREEPHEADTEIVSEITRRNTNLIKIVFLLILFE